MTKKLSLVIMAAFYLLAGINHFYNPEAYYKIIPAWLSNTGLINTVAGLFELLFAVLLLIPQTRRIACYGITCMLAAFIPAHIYMLKVGWCVKGFCLPQWALWVRLVIIQPLLIAWAWGNR